MEDKRKQHALKVIDEALERLSNGVDPLSELKPPPGCHVCAGNVKGTHHFLCRKRALEPTGPERPLRTFVFYKLGSAWREHLYNKSTSTSAVSVCPSPALTLLKPRSVARSRTSRPLNAIRICYSSDSYASSFLVQLFLFLAAGTGRRG